MNNYNREQHFVGKFNIDGEYRSGEIIYNEENGVILLNMNIKIDGIGSSYYKVDYIIGELDSGGVVTLYKNRCVRNHTRNFINQNIQFISEYMILANHEANNKRYNRLVFTVENGVKWSQLSRINRKEVDAISLDPIDKYSFRWFGAEISFSTKIEGDFYRSPIPEKMEIVERLQVEIKNEEKKELDWFIRIQNIIVSMITFSIKDNVNIEKQEFYDDEDKYKINNIEESFKFDCVSANRKKPIYNTNEFEFNCHLNEMVIDNNGEILEKMVPVFDLYASLFRNTDMPIEMNFLNMVQALETFHSRLFYNNSLDEYKKSIDKRFPDSKNDEFFRDMLYGDSQKSKKYIILRSRLYDLIIGDDNQIFNELYINNRDYVTEIIDTRNYYTHYDESKEEKALRGDKLTRITYILKLILEYRVCELLGIENDNAKREFINTFTQIDNGN